MPARKATWSEMEKAPPKRMFSGSSSSCAPRQPRPIIADTFSTLLSTAQIKLGRRDARLFIDLCSVMLEYADRYVSAELGTQVEKALGQLRLGQVSAESEVAKKGEPEPNDLSRVPAPPATSGQAEAPVRGESTSPTSKLWVPGH